MSCSVDCRCGSDLVLLWLWCRLVAVAPIWTLAWEPPYAMSKTLKKTKDRKKKRKNLIPLEIYERKCFQMIKSRKYMVGFQGFFFLFFFLAHVCVHWFFILLLKLYCFRVFPLWCSGNESDWYPWGCRHLWFLCHHTSIPFFKNAAKVFTRCKFLEALWDAGEEGGDIKWENRGAC